MPHDRRGRALELHGERLADRVIGGRQVAREVDVGDVERIADFIVAVGLAVVGELAANLEPRRAEQITQGVFVFVAVEPALRGATLAGDEGAIVRDEDLAQRGEESRGLGRIGAGLFLRRHLAGTQAVVDLDPSRKVGLRREIERERGEVEAGGLVLVVVTGRAVFVGVVAQRRREGGGGRGGEKNKDGDEAQCRDAAFRRPACPGGTGVGKRRPY